MKKRLLYHGWLVFLLFISALSATAQTTYYSRNGATAPRNWDEADSWTLSSDGSGSAASVPGRSDNVVVLNGHDIIIDATGDNGSAGTSPDALGRSNVGTFTSSGTTMFYQTGNITVTSGGTLTISVRMILEGSTLVNGTFNSTSDIVNIGRLEIASSATFDTGDDLILSGFSETLIFNTATSDDDIYLDYTDALLCGNGVMDVGNNSPNTPEIQYFNGATIAQICPDIQITGCTTCPETGTGTFTLATIQKFIAAGSVWKYLDDGSDQGTAWFGTSFDDSGWASGNAELGYGDGDEVTTVSFGGDPNDKHETTYFRKTFYVEDPNDYGSILLRLVRDDGAVVYINGSEVDRQNMPAGSVTFTTFASSAIGGSTESTFFETSLAISALTAGTNTIAIEIHQANLTSSDISFNLELIGIFDEDNLVSQGASWTYLDDGSDQGTAWFGTSFDDSGWASGNAELGYGDGDETTVVSFGGDPNDKHETTYFRHSFSVTDPTDYYSLDLNVLRDDGAVVYINGAEVARYNMPTGSITYTTLASSVVGGADESTFFNVSLNPTVLNAGTNVIAVEIHQANITSSDVSFNLELIAQVGGGLVAQGSSWKYLDDGSDQGTAWSGSSFDDSGWASGNAQLGYGDGDEITVVSFGGDPNDKHETTYFRQSFSVTAPNDYASLELNVLRDDGAVVYINGSEVARFNMPTGSITFTTLASSAVGGAEEDEFFTVSVSTSVLNTGSNIIAVEIHQANVTSSDISFDLQLIGVEPNVLPVELIYFTASSEPTGVSLEWATASEVNNDFFIVEHSVDGYQFKRIAKIEGYGNRENLTHYRTVDHNPYPGLNYYRLKQVDYDGSIDYSDIVSISINNNYDKILIFPNPSSDFIHIKSRTDVSVRGVVIRNLLGQVINVPVAFGETGIVLDVHLLPRGIYFVNMNAGSRIVTKRVIIER